MADINELKAQTENFANAIWTVADILHGPFNDDEYGEVILPFALLRRFECVLEPTREKVRQRAKLLEDVGILGDAQYSQLCVAAGYPFYNTSKFDLKTIGAEHTRENLIAYKNGFSPNVRAIFDHFEFERICERLRKSKKIYAVVDFFQKLDLNVPARVMSNLYEELIWRFADTKHKASKEYLTPRDVVHLATTLVLDSDGEALTSTKGLIRTIYDPTCGTCGFITDAMDFIRECTANNPSRTDLLPYGQEINDIAWAMGKAMILLSGLEDSSKTKTTRDMSSNILLGNTLKEDLHAERTFDYIFSNPPFGMDWKDIASDVERDTRFAVGLPSKSDGSMLFLTHVARKMAPAIKDAAGNIKQCGHAAIVLSGSPLFAGDAGSGPSEIRRWLFENDLVEAIVQLPGELFYNTNIVSYLWILSSGKSCDKKGKVILIDASNFKTPIRNIGKKRFMISRDQIGQIAREFSEFKDSSISKVLNNVDLGYRSITVQRPLKGILSISEDSIHRVTEEAFIKKKMTAENIQALQNLLMKHLGTHPILWLEEFQNIAKANKLKVGKAMINGMRKIFLIKDPTGELIYDSKGNPIFDRDLKDSERISFNQNINDYYDSEIAPFVPDAKIDLNVVDPKTYERASSRPEG